MPTKRTLCRRCWLFSTLLTIGIMGMRIRAQKEPAGVQAIPPPLASMIADAKGADNPEGSKVYARHLADWFVPHWQGDNYVDVFAARLSTGDLMARQGKRKWIPESVVAQAFNDMMIKVHAPLRTDVKVVHQIRTTLYAVSPAFSTVNSHPSTCLPSEAVYLMFELVMENGTLVDLCPPKKDASGHLVQSSCPGKFSAVTEISAYLHSHSRSQGEMLYNHVAKLFGM